MSIAERKQRETDELRERVLDAAEDIIVREGLGRVTMRRIASGVDYAPTVLYRLFADKDDLIDHLIARGYAGVRDRYQEVLQKAGADPLHTLSAILDTYMEYALAHPNHYRMWFETSTIRREGHALKMRHGRLEYTVFQPWIETIAACRAAGHFAERETMDVFQVVWARLHGVISLRLQNPDFPWAPADRHLDLTLDLRGLASA